MTPAHAKGVQRHAGETDRQFARRQAEAAVVRPIFGDVLAKPGQTVVRAEQHVLSAGVGSATTAEIMTRRAAPTAEDDYKARAAALPERLRTLVAGGVPLSTCELFALVLADYASKGAAVKLSPGAVAGMLGIRQDDAAKVLADLIIRGFVVPETGVFGATAGYRPDPKYL